MNEEPMTPDAGLHDGPPVPGATPAAEAPAAVASPPSAPVVAAARPGRSRLRWLTAALVTVVVVLAAVAATMLMTGASGDASVLAWTPADSVVYSEVRLDLPGDQRDALAKTMTAFPGFADQAAFPTKLNEALDQLVKRASNGTQGYTTDVAPWFGGQLSLSVGPIPQSADAKAVRALLLASVKDGVKAAAWANGLLKTAGATTTTETYAGVTITLVTPPAKAGTAAAGMEAAYAVLGPVIALGDQASVKAAIDTGGKRGLATSAQFSTASASLSGDRLAFAYVDGASLAKGARTLAGLAPSAMPQLPSAITGSAPAWTAMALRASGGSFVLEARMPHQDVLGGVAAAELKLPGLVPPSTVALVEGNDLGKILAHLRTLAAADPTLAATVKQLDQALALAGGFDGVAGWMGESGIAVTRDGTTLAGGVVIVPTDRAAADRLLAQLRTVLTLAGGGSGGAATDEAYGGTTITTIDLGNLGALAGAALGGATGGATPALPAHVSISYAVTDQVVVLGSGTGFVKSVLDARTGSSLAKTDRFVKADASVDKTAGALVWLDVAGARDLLEAQIPAASRPGYTANDKPYVDAFDAIIGTYTPGDSVDRSIFTIRLRTP